MGEESADRTVITVWLNHWPLWPELLEPVRERAAEFSRNHPRYRVEIHGIAYPTMPTAVAEAADRGEPPTIAAYQYTVTQEARDAVAKDGTPLFASLEKAIGGRTEILGEPVVVDDIVANARNYYTFGGELVSMPRNTSTALLYANRTLLDAAGVSELPRTWDEVDAACKAVRALPGGPAHAITWPNFGWFFQQSVGQQGGLLADSDNGRSGRSSKVDLASPEMMAYVTWWQRLHENGHYLYTGKPLDWQGSAEAFATQQVAFVLSSSVEAGPTVQAGRDGGFRVEVGRLPYNSHAPHYGNQVAGESWWLANGLDKATADGALAFLQYLASPRHATSVYDNHRTFIPVTEKSIALLDAEGWFEEHPHFRVAIDQLRATTDIPATRAAIFGNFLKIQMATTDAMHDVLAAGADPVARFTAATGEAQRLLDEYNEGVRTRKP
ncbi:sn-glycerol 3-phosphate transport system substrate-binding protein [Amycolatopsis arida]|uniref:sn-glycerol 3-phosphate transport system substrate-binding protein n=1 Tax=Amycolatopsis arida TaxID=587909 RepID=A0A1I5Q9A7_9PSEU|nr:ABC transporter substrate-binding protein [Amycolatopsis arida]TDX98757.1 sn-glycerol 3-phosphate transport system substrate-binding protein [Amycolatopsis arida]SFP42727.1 sn-glycerol 3-phosphate transport system substrate-binding protein [Amycolatopsis arida]